MQWFLYGKTIFTNTEIVINSKRIYIWNLKVNVRIVISTKDQIIIVKNSQKTHIFTFSINLLWLNTCSEGCQCFWETSRLCETINPPSDRGVASGGLQKLLPALACWFRPEETGEGHRVLECSDKYLLILLVWFCQDCLCIPQ